MGRLPHPSVANAGHQRPAMVPEFTRQRVSWGEWAAALPELMALEPQGAMACLQRPAGRSSLGRR
ncbi:hypothetical protein [Denitratisoma oestradiolicum]|nr:hypothetical protein [Denitratisoma oestradiolicum]